MTRRQPIVVTGVADSDEYTTSWPNRFGGVSFYPEKVEGPGDTATRTVMVHLTPFDLYRLLGAFSAAHWHGREEDWRAWTSVMNQLKAMDPELRALKEALDS